MCFSLIWWRDLFVLVVVAIAIYSIIKLLLPLVLNKLGEAGAVLISVVRIVLWAFVAIFVIWICFELISCLWGMVGRGGLSLGRR